MFHSDIFAIFPQGKNVWLMNSWTPVCVCVCVHANVFVYAHTHIGSVGKIKEVFITIAPVWIRSATNLALKADCILLFLIIQAEMKKQKILAIFLFLILWIFVCILSEDIFIYKLDCGVSFHLHHQRWQGYR